MRENQFHGWTITKERVAPLLLFAVVIPGVMYTLMKDEFAIRERAAGRPVVDRL